MGKLLREKTFEWEMAVCDKTFAVAFLYIRRLTLTIDKDRTPQLMHTYTIPCGSRVS